jgi:glycerophosphoryl diester phosphodiesterase
MQKLKSALIMTSIVISVGAAVAVYADSHKKMDGMAPQIGVRPFYLVEDMDAGGLKDELSACMSSSFAKSDFSIGHRGACMQFPEHTRESYIAAAQQGAGIVECDVTFTKDRELVCRHSQCDLHTTTNILAVPELAAKCTEPFKPAEYDPQTGEMTSEATAKCCTSDITLEEFRTLQGKMDGANKNARTVDEYLAGTPSWRTDLYSAHGTLLTHAESIELFQELGVKMTPELKSPSVTMPYQGSYSQDDYAQQMIDEYKDAGVAPEDVYVQSFNLDDVRYWIANEPMFGKQAVYLDGRYDDKSFDHTSPATWSPTMEELAERNVKIIAPPMWMLLDLDDNGTIIPSIYAIQAKAAGLEIITWTLERSGLLKSGGGWYYQTVKDSIDNDGDMLQALDVLAMEVGVLGIFSDWPATVTYYANCKGLK